MGENKKIEISRKIDLLYIAVIAMFFILTFFIFFGGVKAGTYSLILILTLMVGIIISYYGGMNVAIIFSIIFEFVYASNQIFYNLVTDIPIDTVVYYWMIIIPAFSLTVGYKGKIIRKMEVEFEQLKKDNEQLVIIDKETGLFSSQSFFTELQAYMNISRRYNVEVYVMLIQVRFHKEVKNMIGEEKYNKIITKISSELDNILREEDRKFILRDLNQFGLILLSNEGGGKKIENRIRGIVKNFRFEDDILMNKMKIEIQMGVALYDSFSEISPFEFYKLAEKDREYDV